MKKIVITQILFTIIFSLNIQAQELNISMGSASGMLQNAYVKIINKGDVGSGAVYDAATKSIINTSDYTKISILNLDFGNGRYGTYSRLWVQYTNPTISKGFLDVYLDNGVALIASIPVDITQSGEYVESSAELLRVVSGKHTIYIVWREHKASIKTFGAYERKSFADVKAIRTNSSFDYGYTYSYIPDIKGINSVKMVWKNQSANVNAIYFDKSEITSNKEIENNKLYDIGLKDKTLIIISKDVILKNVIIYSLEGKMINEYKNISSVNVSLNTGVYIIKIKLENKSIIKKIIVN